MIMTTRQVLTAGTNVAIADVTTANENAADATFTITLSTASGLPVTFDYESSNGTATAGADYTAVSDSITIAAGSTTGTIAVPVLADSLYEANETVIMSLSNSANASFTDDEATLTITDDDTKPSLSINDISHNETAANRAFTVTLSAAAGINVTVNYATSNGTATAGADYTATSGTLTFTPTQTTKTFNVAVLADSLNEADETVILNFIRCEQHCNHLRCNWNSDHYQ